MSGFKYLRGSEWRKWDLQVHTPFSILNNQFGNPEDGNVWNNYVKELFKRAIEKTIITIGVTDYFTIEGYKKIKDEYLNDEIKLKELFNDEEVQKIKEILLLPNIEFRLAKFVGRNSINFHVIFSDEVSINDIEENFLHELDFVYAGNPQSQDEKWKLKIDNLKGLGRRLKNEQEKFKHKDKLFVGMMNAVVDDSEILDVLSKKPTLFKDKFLIILPADEDLSKIDWNSRDHNFRKVLIQKSDMLFSSNENTKDWALGKKHEHIEGFVKEFKGLKPCIWSSDAHSFDRLFEPDSKRYTWIKANPTFEGLKQIIYEPELRLRIQEEDPRENEVYARIEKCVINFPSDLKIKIEESGKKTDFCLQGKYEVEFSNNLTCVIGGRGTGKSTLIHLLCNACPKKDISKLEELNSPVLSLDLVPDPLRQLADLTTTEIPTNTEFFLQNEIEKFARDIHEMSNLISHRLLLLSSLNNQISLKDLQNEWSMTSQAMNEIIEAYDNISRTTKNIESVNKQIDTLKKQIDVIKSKEYQNFQKIIEDINSKIAEFKRYEDEYKDIIAKIDGLITAFSQLDWSIEQGKGILDELSDLLGDYKKRLKESFDQLSNIFKTNNYTLQLTEKKFQLKKYLEKKGLTEENIEELANASEQIKELEGEIRILERQKVPFEKIYKKRKSILNAYKKKYLAYQNRFFEVATRLEKELEGLPFFDKAISFTPKINKQRLQEDIVTFVKDGSQAKVTLRTNDIQSVLFDVEDIAEYLKSKEKIRDCVNQSTKTVLHKQIIQGLVNDSVFLEKLYLLLWEKYYNISNIQVQTKLGDKLLQNTSFGERCGIVISIILIAGTNPIVIDQPEDNLDGKFISNVLVPLIRKRKLCRQIILVTRDANIVIGGDAELVHILESDENEKKTKILSSSIENIEYRENYIWILDGGKEAFEKREKKYGFKTS